MNTSSQAVPTMVEIDIDAFAHNLRSIRARLSPSCQLMAIVKANAYGHGALPLASVAQQEGVRWLAVARCQEGVFLREEGIDTPVLVLGPVWAEEVEALVAYCLTAVVGTLDDAQRLDREAKRQGVDYPVHVNIDTGMGRLGIAPDMLSTFLERLGQWSSLRLQGLMTHLATADKPEDDITRRQLMRFHQVIQTCRTQRVKPRYVHAANSAALYRYPESHGNLVRPGIALYGSHPFKAAEAMALHPVLTWKRGLCSNRANMRCSAYSCRCYSRAGSPPRFSPPGYPVLSSGSMPLIPAPSPPAAVPPASGQ
jgi:alanine racemase